MNDTNHPNGSTSFTYDQTFETNTKPVLKSKLVVNKKELKEKKFSTLNFLRTLSIAAISMLLLVQSVAFINNTSIPAEAAATSTVFPGCVKDNLRTWFDASKGVNATATGDPVSSWIDRNLSIDATQSNAGAQPKAVENAYNYRPAVKFNGKNALSSQDTGAEIFPNPDANFSNVSFVQNQADTGDYANFIDFGDPKNYNLLEDFPSLGVYYNSVFFYAYAAGATINSGVTVDKKPMIATFTDVNSTARSTDFYLNGDNTQQQVNYSVGGYKYKLGRWISNPADKGGLTIGADNNVTYAQAFNGTMAENITYDRVITKQERQDINSYLATKYGFTLNSDYTTKGQTFWTRSDNPAFSNNVTIIGREDCEGLLQKQSLSINNNPEAIKLYNTALKTTNALNGGSFTADSSYLAAGDNKKVGVITNSPDAAACSAAIDPALSPERTQRIFRMEQSGMAGNANFVQVDWLNTYYNTNGQMYMMVADDEAITQNVQYIPMTKTATGEWKAPYDYEGTKYIAFIGTLNPPPANPQKLDQTIDWSTNAWSGGAGVYGWGPGTQVAQYSNNEATMTVTDPKPTMYPSNYGGAYQAWYPLSFGDRLYFIGIDKDPTDPVTFNTKLKYPAAKGSNFTIHGLNTYYFTDEVKVTAKLNGAKVPVKLTPSNAYPGQASPSVSSGGTADGTLWWPTRYDNYGNVDVTIQGWFDEINVEYMPSNSLTYDWWTDFAISNIRLKGVKPTPDNVVPVAVYKTISPETNEAGNNKTVEFEIVNSTCKDTTVDITDTLSGANKWVAESLTSDGAYTSANAYGGAALLYVKGITAKPGSTFVRATLIGDAAGNFTNQGDYTINGVTAKTDNPATSAYDSTPYVYLVSTKIKPDITITKTADKTTVDQNGIITYTLKVENKSSAPVLANLTDTLRGPSTLTQTKAKYVPGTLVNPVGGTVIGNGTANSYGDGTILAINNATWPVGITEIKVQVNVKDEPVGNVLPNAFEFNVVDPKFSAANLVSPKVDVTVQAKTAPKPPVCTAVPNPSNGTVAAVVTCTGVAPGDTITIPGTTCVPTPADATGIVKCTETTPGTLPSNPVATVKDPTGQTATGTVPYTKDTTAPAVPTCTAVPTTSSPTVKVVITCTGVEPGATVTIPGTTCVPTPATATGTVVCTEDVAGTVGNNPTATVTDPAGNKATAPVPYGSDTTPPAAPVCTAVPTPSNGTVAVVITCTGVEPGATLTIPGTTCVPTPATATSTVVCTETVPGTVTSNPTATVTDPSGNKATAPVAYVLDKTAPAAPVCTSVPTTSSPTVKVVITCTGVEPGSTLTIPGTTCVPTPATSTGIVVCTENVAGTVTPNPVATVTDPAGNKATAPVPYGTDTTAPTAPICTAVPTPSNGTVAVVITCTGVEPGATLTIPGTTCVTTPAGASGIVVCTETVPGTVTSNPTATVTDPSGNKATAPVVYVLDKVAPAAPVCTAVPAAGNGTVAVVITCTGVEPGATLTIPGTTCVPTPATATSTVVCTETTPGTVANNPVATVTDPAGNKATAPVAYTTTKVAPVCTTKADKTVVCTGVTPGDTITIPGTTCVPTPATSTGIVTCTLINPADPAPTGPATITDPKGVTAPVPIKPLPVCTTAADKTVTCTGVTPGDTVTIPGTVCVPTPAPSTGIVKCTLINPADPAPKGPAIVTDPAGNTTPVPLKTTPICTAQADKTVICSPVTPGDTITIPGTTCVPTPATATGIVTCTLINPADPTPVGPATVTDPKGVTAPVPIKPLPVCTTAADKTVTCTGVTPGDTVTIPGTTCVPTPATATGIVKCTLINPADPAPTGPAIVTDPAGTKTPVPLKTTADTTPPAAPVCTSVPAVGNGTVAVVITCIGVEPGATLTIPGTTCVTTPAGASGIVVCTETVPGTVGSNPVATVTDPAGNKATSVVPYTKDTTPPVAPVCTTNADKTVTCTGVTPGDTVTIPGTTCVPTPATATGIVTCTLINPADPAPTGPAIVKDPAGNTTPVPLKPAADTTAPAAPVCTSVPAVGNGTTAVVVTCTGVEPGATLTIPGTTCVPTPATATGIVVCTETVPGTLTSNPIATVTDPAGNKTPSTFPYTKDTTAPVAPTCVTNPDKTVTCTGVTPGDTITIPGTTCVPTPATATGIVKCTLINPADPAPTGPAVVKDPAGNTTTTPVKPLPVLNIEDPYTCGGKITGKVTPYTPGAVVTVTITKPDGTVAGVFTPTLAADGSFVVDISALPNGNYTNTYKVVNPDGLTAQGTYNFVKADCVIVPPVCTTNADKTVTCTGVTPGNTVTIPGTTCVPTPATATGIVTCTLINPADPAPTGPAIVKDTTGSTISVPLVDKIAPAVPTCTSVPNPSNGMTKVVVTCTGVEPGATVTIPGTVCVPTPATATGTVVCTEITIGTLPSNPVITIKDPAGNIATGTVPFTNNPAAPVAPTCITQANKTVTCTGVTPGDTVTIPGTICVPSPATATGIVTCTLINPSAPAPVGPGTVTNPAGVSTPTPIAPLPADTTPPALPTCTSVPNPSNGMTKVVVTCTGVEPGATVTIPGTVCVPTPATATGTVVCTEITIGTLPSNPVIMVKDPAGNSVTGLLPFVNTPPAPVAPTCITNANKTVTCSGVTPGDVVTIPGTTCVPSPATSTGTVTCTLINPADPAPVGPAKVTNPAGGMITTPIVPIPADTTAPLAPTCTAVPNPSNGMVAVVVTCTGVEPGATLTLPGAVCVPTPATSTGIVKCTEITPGTLPSNPTVTVKDPAGNAVTSTLPYIKDMTPPVAPTCITNANKTVTCSGVTPGDVVTIPGTTCVPTPANYSGTVTCTLINPADPAPVGPAKVTNPAGVSTMTPIVPMKPVTPACPAPVTTACCSNPMASPCCGGISNIVNTNTITVNGTSGNVFAPVYSFNNIFSSQFTFTASPMNITLGK